MKHIADLFFEAGMLKQIPRSGYHFLGTGQESVAEHTFMVVFIAWVMSRLLPEVDAARLMAMCLVHDLPEARIGDLNTVQKRYVHADESRATRDMIRDLPFGSSLAGLLEEFNAKDSPLAELAHDADQLAFILDLKAQMDMGRPAPAEWLPSVLKRLKTETGRILARGIQETNRDDWWRKILLTDPG
ncbi:MAG: HD domain-containing protein [Thermodesulfobacteriota bacterium]